MSSEEKNPILLDLLLKASENYQLEDAAGYIWSPESIKVGYDVIEGEYGNPFQLMNKGNILSEIIKSMVRYKFGDDFSEEQSQYKSNKDFLDKAYRGLLSNTQENKDKMINIYKEWEDKYNFLNKKGESVALDMINRNLYSVEELRNLYFDKYQEQE